MLPSLNPYSTGRYSVRLFQECSDVISELSS